MKINTLLHKLNDFVGVVTKVDDRMGVYVAYYKWLPYSQPDNAISGMTGWYRVEEMEKYVTTAEDRIFKQYGLPPEYKKDDRREEISSKLREIMGHTPAYDGEMHRLMRELVVNYVMGLLNDA